MCEDSDQEISDLDIESKTWKKLENTMKSMGFREGAAKGMDLAIQEGFNLGYKDGFKLGKSLGMIRGTKCYDFMKNSTSPLLTDFDGKTFDQMAHELCGVCSLEKDLQSCYSTDRKCQTLEDLVTKQQSINKSVMEKLSLKSALSER